MLEEWILCMSIQISTCMNAQGIYAWGPKYSMHEHLINSPQMLERVRVRGLAAGAALLPLPGAGHIQCRPVGKLMETPKMPQSISPQKSPQYLSLDTFKEEKQLQAVETHGSRNSQGDVGLELCSGKEALHVPGVHPTGWAPGQSRGGFNFFCLFFAEVSETSHLEPGIEVV